MSGDPVAERQGRWFSAVFFVGVILAHVYIAFGPHSSLYMWYRSDDAFYYFKTAQNIASGYGSTFDRLNLTNGYQPLWMLICIPVFALARTDLWLPLRLLIVTSGALTAGSGVLIFRMIARSGHELLGMLAAFAWSWWPSVHITTTQLGLENALNGFCLALVLYLLSGLESNVAPRRPSGGWFGLAVAALILSRLDNLFVGLLFGLWYVLRGNPYRTRILMYIFVVVLGYVGGLLWRFDVAVVPVYKTGASIVLVLALLVKIPGIVLLANPAAPRWSSRAASFLLGSTLASGAIVGAVVGLRMVGLPSFPLSALAVDWLFTSVGLLAAEALLSWLAVARPPQRAPESLRMDARGLVRSAGLALGLPVTILAVYLVGNAIAFGTALPVSGQVKEWWGTIHTVYGIPARTVLEFLGLDPQREAAPLQFLSQVLTFSVKPLPGSTFVNVLALYGIVSLWLMRRPSARAMARDLSLLPLAIGSCVQIWVYGIRGYVNPGEWYWIAEVMFAILGASTFLAATGERLRVSSLVPTPARHVVAGGLCLFIVWRFSSMVGRLFPHTEGPAARLEEEIEFLQTATQDGAVIGIPGGGTLGYFTPDRTIVNLDGLANSYGYFLQTRRGLGAQYLAKIGLEYVFASPGMLAESEPYMENLAGSVVEIESFKNRELYALYVTPEP